MKLPYSSGDSHTEYDCSGVNSAAFDAAIKSCIEANKIENNK